MEMPIPAATRFIADDLLAQGWLEDAQPLGRAAKVAFLGIQINAMPGAVLSRVDMATAWP